MAAITHPRSAVSPLPLPLPLPFVGAARRPAPTRAAVYRRRRLLVATLFLGVLLTGSWALGALGGGSLTASEAGSPSVPVRTLGVEVRALAMQPVRADSHVVVAGDTLWSIARRLQPTGDVRPLVDALAAQRGGRPLQVGERLSLP